MKFFLSLILLFSACRTSAQMLRGRVVDEAGRSVPMASVFLSNTSVGTRADTAGRFVLPVPQGKFDLVVTSVGYETFTQAVRSGETGELLIRLKLRTETLETVVVEPYEKDGWEKWGRFFTESFIGTMNAAQECRILNPQVLRFRNSKKTNELTVSADEPLIIENRYLGYRLVYQLETFQYGFRSHFLSYTGFPLFQPLPGNEARQKRWEKRRRELYAGSLLHFMRSVYRNTLAQEGFEIHPLRKLPNEEKLRVKQRMEALRTGGSNGQPLAFSMPRDSADYYREIMQQGDQIDVVSSTLLVGDSIAYAVNATTAALDFPNYLLILYKAKSPDPEYTRLNPQRMKGCISQLVLVNGTPVEVEANGSFFMPTDLMIYGYWAWSEKIATMLPFDYKAVDR